VTEKRKARFEVPDSSLVECGTVSAGKRQTFAGEYCLHLRDPAVEE